MAQDQSQVFVIVADSGGGDGRNPHASLASAMARISREETGVEVWRIGLADYERCNLGKADVTQVGKCVFERW